MSQQFHKMIIHKMHHFVGEVIRNINKRQRALRVYVKTEFFDVEQLPPGNSRHVYPEERGIRKHICDAKPKLRMPKVGQVFSINTKIVNFSVCVLLCVCYVCVCLCMCRLLLFFVVVVFFLRGEAKLPLFAILRNFTHAP